jgi:hypothetical protein
VPVVEVPSKADKSHLSEVNAVVKASPAPNLRKAVVKSLIS